MAEPDIDTADELVALVVELAEAVVELVELVEVESCFFHSTLPTDSCPCSSWSSFYLPPLRPLPLRPPMGPLRP